MTELQHKTFDEVESLFGPRSIAILPMGSTEPHGPHLPLDTDVCIAVARARRAAELLAQAGVASFVLPAIPYGVTRLTQDFAGGVTMRPGTLWALIEDMALSLQQDGVQQLVLCNAHHEFDHTRILANIASDYIERGPGRCQIVYPDSAADPDADAFPREIDCHGGAGETSLMLAIAPERVRRELLAGLDRVDLELPVPEARVNRSLRSLGAKRAYCGAPAEADAEMGRQLLDQLAQTLVAACRAAWPDLFDAPASTVPSANDRK